VAVIPAEFGWNDVGSWATLLEILDNDEYGNVIRRAEHVASIPVTHWSLHDRLEATIGLHDMIVMIPRWQTGKICAKTKRIVTS
jgi:mannose-1-phosphate guanylyltransferase